MCGPHIAIAPDDPRDRPAVGLAGYDLPFSLQTLYIRRVGLLPARGGSGICGVVRNLLPKFEQKGGDLLVHSAAVVHEEDLVRPGGDQGAFSANVVP